MKYLQHLDNHQIANLLKLQRLENGYRCPRLEREHKISMGKLMIWKDGIFNCSCGISGQGWASLTAQLFKINKYHAMKWLDKKMGL